MHVGGGTCKIRFPGAAGELGSLGLGWLEPRDLLFGMILVQPPSKLPISRTWFSRFVAILAPT